jgi:hypothetical protein
LDFHNFYGAFIDEMCPRFGWQIITPAARFDPSQPNLDTFFFGELRQSTGLTHALETSRLGID